jgi:hypothetical protein
VTLRHVAWAVLVFVLLQIGEVLDEMSVGLSWYGLAEACAVVAALDLWHYKVKS